MSVLRTLAAVGAAYGRWCWHVTQHAGGVREIDAAAETELLLAPLRNREGSSS